VQSPRRTRVPPSRPHSQSPRRWKLRHPSCARRPRRRPPRRPPPCRSRSRSLRSRPPCPTTLCDPACYRGARPTQTCTPLSFTATLMRSGACVDADAERLAEVRVAMKSRRSASCSRRTAGAAGTPTRSRRLTCLAASTPTALAYSGRTTRSAWAEVAAPRQRWCGVR
jgi:hypothetical protein